MKPTTTLQICTVEELPVTLQHLLKYESLVGSGGEAKHVITSGLVRVNGEIETRRSRKLNVGDEVSFGEVTLRLRATEE